MEEKLFTSYKDVCGDDDRVWFSISDRDSKKFMKWAKGLGCKWVSGEEINPRKHRAGRHMSIRRDGGIAFVAYFVWFAPQMREIKKYKFDEYLKGNLVLPEECNGGYVEEIVRVRHVFRRRKKK
ncbi:MAG: hypothetical protein IJX06_02515 [Clostridia bacterium]|nr:hypothetical protein [Clostridia bacterium]